MFSHSFLNDISDVFETWCELFHFVVAKGNVVSDVALVAADLKGLSELVLGLFIFLLFVEDAALSDYSLGRFGWQLADK